MEKNITDQKVEAQKKLSIMLEATWKIVVWLWDTWLQASS